MVIYCTGLKENSKYFILKNQNIFILKDQNEKDINHIPFLYILPDSIENKGIQGIPYLFTPTLNIFVQKFYIRSNDTCN